MSETGPERYYIVKVYKSKAFGTKLDQLAFSVLGLPVVDRNGRNKILTHMYTVGLSHKMAATPATQLHCTTFT